MRCMITTIILENQGFVQTAQRVFQKQAVHSTARDLFDRTRQPDGAAWFSIQFLFIQEVRFAEAITPTLVAMGLGD